MQLLMTKKRISEDWTRLLNRHWLHPQKPFITAGLFQGSEKSCRYKISYNGYMMSLREKLTLASRVIVLAMSMTVTINCFPSQ